MALIWRCALKRKGEALAKSWVSSLWVQAGPSRAKKMEGSSPDANANAVDELSLGGSSETVCKKEWKNNQMAEDTWIPGSTRISEADFLKDQETRSRPCMEFMLNSQMEEEKKRKAEEKVQQETRYRQLVDSMFKSKETRYRQLVDSMFKSKSTQYRQRFLDLMSKAREKMETRGNVDKYIRSFLDNRGFVQVYTPTTNMIAGGAAAKLFFNYHNDLDTKLYMHTAPALYLQEIVVHEIASVYAIGKPFLHEVISPEFTTCMFYKVFADYYDLMELTEEMLSGMVKEITGGYKIKYHANGLDNDPIEIDFTPPFRRIEMIEELEKIAKISIPKDIASDEANKYLVEACTKFEINCPPPQTTPRLLAKLVGHFLEEMCVNPAFIINHPEIMSPLAKGHRSKPGLTERFELFINKHEVCNAYTVLTDLVVQCQRFADQVKYQTSVDDEAMSLAETFCSTTLAYGLAPSAGWGLSIDRLAMLFTDSQAKEEVLLFPAMKPQDEPQIKGLDKGKGPAY